MNSARVLTLAALAGLFLCSSPSPASAEERVTVVTRDGRQIEGELVRYAGGAYTLRVNGEQLVLSSSDVVRVELVRAELMSLQGGGRPLREVVAEIAAFAGQDLGVHAEVQDEPVEVALTDLSWQAMLEAVADAGLCRVEFVGGNLLVVCDDEARLMAELDEIAPDVSEEQRINVDVVGVDLAEVMDQVGLQLGRTILVDPDVHERVTINLRDIPWREAVEVMARMTRCRVEDRPGGVLLLTQPARVTIQFANGNVNTVLQLLAAYSGKSIVIDADVEGTITIDIVEQPWDEALVAICEAAGLYPRLSGGIVGVGTTPPAPGQEFRIPGRQLASGFAELWTRSFLDGDTVVVEGAQLPLLVGRSQDGRIRWQLMGEEAFRSSLESNPSHLGGSRGRDVETEVLDAVADSTLAERMPQGGERARVSLRPNEDLDLDVYAVGQRVVAIVLVDDD
jgi:hypothetical protein